MADPERIAQLEDGVELWSIDIEDVRERDVNARVMPPGMFERLRSNIGERSALVESLPYTHLGKDGHVTIISGHHRVRAARAAGIGRIHILVDTKDMTDSEITAKQLAHNALAGEDDDQMLRMLVESLDSVEDILHSYIAVDDLTSGDPLTVSPMVQIDFDFKLVTFSFLPSQMDDFADLIGALSQNQELLGAVSMEQYTAFEDALADVKRVKTVASVGTAIAMMVKAAKQMVADEAAVAAEG